MRKKVLIILRAILICAGTGQATSAQITINIPGIPRFPKVRKEKQEPARQFPASAPTGQESQTTENADYKKVPAASEQQDHPGLVYEVEKIEKMRVAIDKYSSEWPYWPENTYKNFTLFAVSKRERENYLKGVEAALQTGPHRAKLHAALDALAASAAKKLPIYKPAAQTFSVRSPANEKIILQKLKERLGNTATLTFYKTGFQSNWQIYKDSIGLPQYRFMRGYIYAKKASDDHPYCHLYYVSVSQQYAGGGTYGSSYATFEDDLVVGCP